MAPSSATGTPRSPLCPSERGALKKRTSIINRLQEDWRQTRLSNLAPTIGQLTGEIRFADVVRVEGHVPRPVLARVRLQARAEHRLVEMVQ